MLVLLTACLSACQTNAGSTASGKQSIWPDARTALSQQDGRDEYGSYNYVETFVTDGLSVHAYEYDDLIGPFGRLHAFWIMYPERPTVISQGSYDLTTQIAREMGDIGPSNRIYHVDRYEQGEPVINSDSTTSVFRSHSTITMTLEPLNYEQVKQIVMSYLQSDGT